MLVGDLGDVFHTHVPELRRVIARIRAGRSRVNFTGFVPDDELAFLYQRAYALVQPSLMEGLRPAAGRGDGLRDARARQPGGLAAGGRRRRRPVLRPDRRRGDGRGAPPFLADPRPATPGDGPGAVATLHLVRVRAGLARLFESASGAPAASTSSIAFDHWRRRLGGTRDPGKSA